MRCLQLLFIGVLPVGAEVCLALVSQEEMEEYRRNLKFLG